MRRCISEPTIRFPRPAPRSVATSAFTTPGALIRALTGRRQTMLTSLACRTSRQPEPGRRSTYQNRNAVQTNRATALLHWLAAHRGSLNPADVPLIKTETLFRQTEPPLREPGVRRRIIIVRKSVAQFWFWYGHRIGRRLALHPR